LVVLAVGASPRLELATAAGLRTSEAVAGSGVAVDAALLSSVPGVYAIGDIAAHAHPRLGPLRVEHWANAKYQGEHVAAVLLGEAGDYSGSPYFFSDQYDLGCEYRGLADPAKDELVVRGDLAARDFTAFWLREGAVVAAMNVNQWDDGDALDALVGNGVRVSAADLREGDLAALS
ncbi:MAG: oxidoreductase C-terminal domain-containing protein, partial [Sciscionella sp.]